jgi:hypothetical protein
MWLHRREYDAERWQKSLENYREKVDATKQDFMQHVLPIELIKKIAEF